MKWISKRTLLPVSAVMRKAIEEYVQKEKEKAMQQREGSLGIIRYESTVANIPEEYDVTFARYDYSGVLRARRLRGRDALVGFLQRDVHLNASALSTAMEKIDAERGVHVPNVVFTDDEIARLGFAA
jgi:hypothetical protein